MLISENRSWLVRKSRTLNYGDTLPNTLIYRYAGRMTHLPGVIGPDYPHPRYAVG